MYRTLFVSTTLLLFVIQMLWIQPAHSQFDSRRWDFNSNEEGWVAENGSISAIDGKLELAYPPLREDAILRKSFVNQLSLKKIIISVKAVSSEQFYNTYIKAIAYDYQDLPIASTQTSYLYKKEYYSQMTFVFDEAVKNPIFIRFYFTEYPGKLYIDWIETKGEQQPSGNFDIFVDPPGNVLQQGTQSEFNVISNWPQTYGSDLNYITSTADADNGFELIEDSLYGEISDLVVGENEATAKFIFNAQELGEHIVNFSAQLEMIPNAPISTTYQLPITVIEENPDDLFQDASCASHWMFY